MRCGFLALAISSIGALLGEETSPPGTVHGPKAGFNISAPEGWVVDNESGKGQDLPCVLYPKDSSWSDAKTVMYAKVASPQWEGVNAFVATAIKEMKAKHGTPKEKIASGKTKDGHDYFINEYPATKTYSQWERVGYVQLPQGVGLHRPHIPRSSQLPERFRRARESSENPGLRRAEVGGRQVARNTLVVTDSWWISMRRRRSSRCSPNGGKRRLTIPTRGSRARIITLTNARRTSRRRNPAQATLR